MENAIASRNLDQHVKQKRRKRRKDHCYLKHASDKRHCVQYFCVFFVSCRKNTKWMRKHFARCVSWNIFHVLVSVSTIYNSERAESNIWDYSDAPIGNELSFSFVLWARSEASEDGVRYLVFLIWDECEEHRKELERKFGANVVFDGGRLKIEGNITEIIFPQKLSSETSLFFSLEFSKSFQRIVS